MIVLFAASLIHSNTVLADTHVTMPANNTDLPTCVYIASYAPGYVWQDGIERALKQQLNQACSVKTFYMNTKKILDTPTLEQLGLNAKAFIDSHRPNVVIVSDDDAVKYVLQRHYHNHALPFVFCGLNNGGANYGLPYSNATGMIESSPMPQLLKLLFSLNPAKTHVAYLTTLGTTAEKDILAFKTIMNHLGTPHSIYTAADEAQWRSMYQRIQENPQIDLVFLGNHTAFKQWNHPDNLAFIKTHSQKLSVAEHTWMMPYVSLGILKSPDEHGYWAGQTAKAILNGMPIARLPVVPNRNFQLWVNLEQLAASKQNLPDSLLSQAILYREPNTAFNVPANTHASEQTPP
jgi:hypothetical protein